MDRRKFLKNGSIAGLALGSIGIVSGNTIIPEMQNTVEPDSMHLDDKFSINEITIDELQHAMKNGLHTSRSITELYLKRIDEIDKKGIKLNSIIELNPDALAIADQMDLERKQNKIRGPMHGIPFLIKDNIDTADKMMTTAGSLAMEGNRAAKDAFVVSQLRAAGAVLLGKTNLSEWANFRSSRPTSGWSSRGGQTKNPCVLDRNPCGSSSGSAAAVSANLCAVAVGTETDGSVIAPASFCGIVGIKPTVGLVSRQGIIPISTTQDTAGSMARTVTDAAILLSVMSGIDSNDHVTLESRGKSHADYTKFLDPAALKGKRIGIEKSFLQGHEGVVDLFKKAIDVLKKQGAEIIEVELMKPIKEIGDAEFIAMQFEFKDGLNRYLSKANAKIKSLDELIAFNKQHEDQVMPYFKQETLELCNSKSGLDSKEYLDAIQKSLYSRVIIDELFKINSLDSISAPSIGPANLIDLVNGDYDTGFYFCPPAAMAGYPHITVPMGKIHELPVGLSFMGRPYMEHWLFGIAFAFEQATKKRMAPGFIKTACPL